MGNLNKKDRTRKARRVRIIRFIWLLLAVCVFLACSQKEKTLHPVQALQSAQPGQAGQPAQPAQPVQSGFHVPLISVQGTGSHRLGEISLADSVGYCELDGIRVAAVAYNVQDWKEYDLEITAIVAPTSDNLNILYLYSRAGKLRSVWHEDYSRSLKSEKATGEYLFSGKWGNVRPQLNVLEKVPYPNQLVHDIEITGEGIAYRHREGAIRIENVDYQLYPFEYVDCSDCVRGPLKGWQELHSIIQAPGGDLGFGVLYLYTKDPGRILLHYHIRFHPLKAGPGSSFQGTWHFPE